MLFVNRDEARALSGTADPEEQMRLLGKTCERVVLKLGANGAALGNSLGTVLTLPAPKVQVIDTTGAGDAFAAAFLTADLNGELSEDCLAAGIAAGSEAVKKIGGQPG